MASTAAAEVQALLRFLTQDAKVPLAAALPKIGQLRKENLNNAEIISKANLANILHVFGDQKLAKQILNAAKRVSNPKKRANHDSASPSSGAKRVKNGVNGGSMCQEDALQLPTTSRSEAEIMHTTIQTNRAPLVLAFAFVLLKHTMPEQPLSSRLSLAQAVVSANSQSKAKSIGIISEKTAEDEGWGQGQPRLRVMGREVAVMRRSAPVMFSNEDDSQATMKSEEDSHVAHDHFWGLDLEALRTSNGPLVAGLHSGGHAVLPIHSPQAARSYLLKSFTILEAPIEDLKVEGRNIKSESPLPTKKASAAEAAARREEGTAMLLKALELLYESWSRILSDAELDRRAWSWYLSVRPEVAQGQAGWGQKGQIRLEDILKLRREVQQ